MIQPPPLESQIEACQHDYAIYVGYQEGCKDLPGWEIGECIKCKTSFSLADYRMVHNMWQAYRGNSLYRSLASDNRFYRSIGNQGAL